MMTIIDVALLTKQEHWLVLQGEGLEWDSGGEAVCLETLRTCTQNM